MSHLSYPSYFKKNPPVADLAVKNNLKKKSNGADLQSQFFLDKVFYLLDFFF